MIPRSGSRALRPADGQREPAHAGRSPVVLAVATLLRDRGPLTVREIATRLSRSRGAISEAVVGLRELGVAREAGIVRPHRAGRPARSFDFCADDALVVGAEIGCAHSRVVAVDARGVVRVEREVVRSGRDRGDGVVDHVEVDELLALVGVPPARIRAIGIAVAASGAPSRAGDAHRRLAPSLEKRYGCPVLIDDARRLTAVAEHNSGASSLVDDVLHISVREVVETFLILGGRVREARRAVPHSPVGHEQASADDTEYLARRLSAVVRAVDPALVVVAGPPSRRRALADRLSRQLAAESDVPVVPAVLGDMAPCYGAAVATFERFVTAVDSYPALPAPRFVSARTVQSPRIPAAPFPPGYAG